MSLFLLTSFLGGVVGTVIAFLSLTSVAKKKSSIQTSIESQPREPEKIELPSEFTVEDSDLHLQFEKISIPENAGKVEELVRFYISQGYQEINNDQLSQSLATGLQKSILEKNRDKVIADQILSSVVPFSTIGYSALSVVSAKDGIYKLARALKDNEKQVQYANGAYSSVLWDESTRKFSGHVGYKKMSTLRTAILTTFVWYIGNFVFSTIHLNQINQNLKDLRENIKRIIDKLNFEKTGRIKAIKRMLIKLYEIKSYHYLHLLEVKQYYKELLELYEYYYINIQNNKKEVNLQGFFTSTKVKNVENCLDNSKILEDIISIYECLKLLKFAEIVKLKIIHSLRDDDIFLG